VVAARRGYCDPCEYRPTPRSVRASPPGSSCWELLGQASTDAVNRASRLAYGEATGITQTVRNFAASLGIAVLEAAPAGRNAWATASADRTRGPPMLVARGWSRVRAILTVRVGLTGQVELILVGADRWPATVRGS
jgi:hypothetical protein